VIVQCDSCPKTVALRHELWNAAAAQGLKLPRIPTDNEGALEFLRACIFHWDFVRAIARFVYKVNELWTGKAVGDLMRRADECEEDADEDQGGECLSDEEREV
jgi:hypothetical protein